MLKSDVNSVVMSVSNVSAIWYHLDKQCGRVEFTDNFYNCLQRSNL